MTQTTQGFFKKHYKRALALLLVLLLFFAVATVFQVAENKDFEHYATNIVNKYGGLTDQAILEIQEYSELHYGGRHSVVSVADNGQHHDGETINFKLSSKLNLGLFTMPLKMSYDIQTVLNNEVKDNEHTVTFNSNGGSEIATQQVQDNKKASQPTAPTKEGSTFKGWEPSLSQSITANTTFTAQWSLNEYIVTFDSAGGSTIKNQKVEYNNKITQPKAPSKTGYVFMGWSPAVDQTIIKDITFTAQWNKTVENDNKHTDAALSHLTLNGKPLPNFASDQYHYTIELAAGTVDIPSLVATVSDTGRATVIITPPTSLPGKTIVLVRAEDGKTTKEYTFTFVVTNADQAAPLGLVGFAPSSYGLSDGKITGTTSAMEYKSSSLNRWIVATGKEITGLMAGTYHIRYIAKTGFNVGLEKTIEVKNGIIPITITASSDHKIYDGLALVKDNVLTSGLLDGHILSKVTVLGSQINVGSSDNVASAAIILDKDNNDVTINYNIKYINGTLTINKKDLKITASSNHKIYDALSLVHNEATPSGLLDGHTLGKVTVNGSQTLAGSSDNVASAAIILDAATKDVTSNYAITYIKGTLTVDKKAVSILVDASTKVYGETDPVFTGSVSGLIESTDLKMITYVRENTTENNAGAYDKTLTAHYTANDNYLVSVTAGDFTITKATGSALNIEGYTGIYDGTGHSVTINNLVANDSVVYSPNQHYKNVGIHAIDISVTNPNYEERTGSATITITQKPLEITALSESKTYNGLTLTNINTTSLGLLDGHTLSKVTVNGSQTTAGTSDNVASDAVISDKDNNDVTSNYNIKYVNGTLIVTKATGLGLDITDYTGVYDGSEHSVTINNLVANDVVVYSPNQHYKNAGAHTIDILVTNPNYEDRTGSGTVTITQRPLEITADSASKEYDATPLIINNSNITNGTLVIDDRLVLINFEGSQTEVGSSNNVASAAIILDAATKDVTSNYAITYIKGTLTVDKKAVSILVDKSTKVYGEVDPIFKGSVTGLIESSDLGTITYSRTNSTENNVGLYDKVLTAQYTTNDNYNVTVTAGNFTITKATGSVLAILNYLNVYDGLDHSIVVANLLENDKATYSVDDRVTWTDSIPNFTDVGKQIIYVNVTNPNYKDRTGSGTIDIFSKLLQITAPSATKTYDGLALVNTNVTSLGLIDGHTMNSVAVTGSQTIAGSSNNVASGTVILDANENDVTLNYSINYVDGTLTITKATGLELDITDYTGVYDGSEHSISINNLIANDVVVYSPSEHYKNVGVFTTEVSVTNPNYEERTGSGTVTITQKPLEITASSDNKTYDGLALININTTSSGLIAGHTINKVNVDGSQTAAGVSTNVASGALVLDAEGKDVTSNYNISYINGTLTVTKATGLMLDIKDYSGIYDGSEHGVTVNNLVANDNVVYSPTSSYKNVGIFTIEVSVTNPNYEERTGSGTVTITQKSLEVTAGSASKEYDASPLIIKNYNITNGTLVIDERLALIDFEGSQTEAGTSINIASGAVILDANDNDVTSNYSINYVNGDLIVNKKAIIVTASSDTKTYDGVELFNTNALASGLISSHTMSTVALTGSQTIAGTSDNEASVAIILDATTKDVTSNYSIEYIHGTLTVNQKEVSIMVDASSKTYGQADPLFTGLITGLVATDDLGTVSYARTNINENSVGTYNKVLTASYTTNENYVVTVINGNFIINKATGEALVITNYSDVYDGSGHGITLTNIIDGDSVKYSTDNKVTWTDINPKFVSVGERTIDVKVTNPNYEDRTGSGMVTINQRSLKITASSDNKTYDGTLLKNSGFSISSGSLASTDILSKVTVTGSQKNVGSSDNIISAAVILDAGSNNVTSNYAIEYVKGTLTINRASIALNITLDNASKVYNGNNQTLTTYTKSIDLFNGLVLSGIAADKTGRNVGDYSIMLIGEPTIKDGTVDVTENFDISLTPGTLTITKKAVFITAGSQEFTYDGATHTNNKYTVNGLVGSDAITAVVEGSITTPSESPVSNDVVSHEFTKGISDNYAVTMVSGKLTMLNANQIEPKGLVGVTPTAANNDGKITGTTNAMEYRKNGDNSWLLVEGTEITNLSSGLYDVRYAAKDGYNASPIVNVQIPVYIKSTDATLKSISVAPETIAEPSYFSNGTQYVTLFYQTVDVPEVVAIANSPKATVLVTQATSLPGKTTILTTAENGTQNTYYVDFKVLSEYTIDKAYNSIEKYNGYDKVVEIPDKIDGMLVKAINRFAFKNKQLTSVTLPNTLTEIADRAFEGNLLETLVIPDSVVTIGTAAFTNAFDKTKETSVILGNGLTTIRNDAFRANDLNSVLFGNNISVIESYAFSSNKLTSIVLPKAVKSIAQGTFTNNILTSVTLGSNVTTIMDSAFSTNQILSIVIPESVTYIGKHAFSANHMNHIEIYSKNLTQESYAFEFNGTANDSYALPQNAIQNYFGIWQLNSDSKPSWVKVIASSITIIGEDSVLNGETLQFDKIIVPTELQNMQVTWSVSTLDSGKATINSNGLLSATAPGTVLVKILANDGSFKEATKVITIDFNQADLLAAKELALGAITKGYNTFKEEEYDAEDWSTLTGYKTSGEEAINSAINLSEVALAKSNALNAMESVNKKQSAPVGLLGVAPTYILNDGKIQGTTSAMEYKLSSSSEWKAILGTSIQGLTTGDYDVRFLAKKGFNLGHVATITVPAFQLKPVTAVAISGKVETNRILTASVTPSVATVNYQWMISDSSDGVYMLIDDATSKTYTTKASDYNKFIKVKVTGIQNYGGSIESSSTVAVSAPTMSEQEAYDAGYRWESIPIAGKDTFKNMIYDYVGTEKDLIIVTKIGITNVQRFNTNAFAGLGLNSVMIPSNVTSIGTTAFANNNLTSITIPNSVTILGSGAFTNNKITSIVFSKNVKVISFGAFERNKLTSLNIPNTVTTIEINAFRSNNLTSIILPNSITTIDGFAFNHNELTSVTIPNTVTTIGENAFGNNKISEFIMSDTELNPSKLISIGQAVLYSNNLTSITIPNSVKTIGSMAFLNNNFTEITLGSNVAIGDDLFISSDNHFKNKYDLNGKLSGTYFKDTNGIWTKQ